MKNISDVNPEAVRENTRYTLLNKNSFNNICKRKDSNKT